jgi:hypothetical protein
MRWSLLIVALTTCLAVPACVKSAATQCGDDLCPAGLACANDHCVDNALVSSCAGRAEGAACSVGAGGSGVCQDHLCIVGRCGDGMINGVEDCDGANLGGKSCLDFGASAPMGLTCGSDCTLDPAGCTEFCGNGIADGSEQCDGADLAQKSCVDYGFYAGTLSCTSTCMANLGQCSGRCGDGTIEELEVCDGANLNNKTCATLGYMGTVLPLTCTAECAYDPSSCTCGGVLCATGKTCVVTGTISACE